MKKIFFFILVYFFTTASFFKSALEDCADESFKYSNSIPSIEYKNVKLSKESYQKLLNEHKRYKDKALKKHFALPICANPLDATKYDMDSFKPKCRRDPRTQSSFTLEQLIDNSFQFELDQAKKVKTKEYTKSEMKRKYKNFLKKPLKIKMDNNKYYKNYSGCVAYKKRSPELFEAKYD